MADQTAPATAKVFGENEPVPAEGGAAEAPDLSAAELLPTVGGGDESKRKSTFALLKAEGAALPSASSKFVGTTPKAAVMKAARRIHKRTEKTEFSVLMRRVASHKVDKKLYKYAVTMKKRSRPTGFVTLIDPRFVVEKEVKKKGVVTKKAGDVEINVAKKVPIVAESEHPVYGYVAEDGTLAKGDAAGSEFVVVRPTDTNTLYLVVPGAIPDAINGVTVVKTDWDVASLEDAPITEEEREEYDIAGRAKTQGDEDAKKKSETAKAAAEKRKLKTREDKAKAKDALKAKREKERAKKDAAKAKVAEKKAKAAEKKAAAAAKKAAKKSA